MVSTVFDGVAFSLARGEIARELSFAIGLSRYGVRWGKRGAPIVFTAVLFAVPASAEQVYLSLVMTFSALLKNKLFFPLLCQSKHPKDMLAVLSQAFLS
jgi:mannitol/fructose-specific phosphotransferase system IIA component (Ntr-type)